MCQCYSRLLGQVDEQNRQKYLPSINNIYMSENNKSYEEKQSGEGNGMPGAEIWGNEVDF